MAKENNIDDQMISKLVQTVRYRVPETVEAKVSAAMSRQEKTRGVLKSRLWYPVSAALAMLVIAAAVFVFQPFMNNTAEEVSPITEIKTELELPDANIKIIWVQKKDFKLN